MADQALVRLRNSLNGTANNTQQVMNKHRQEPAAGSPAHVDIHTDEEGPGGRWGREPAHTFLSYVQFSINAAVDHLGSMGELITGEGLQTAFGLFALARMSLEASARAAWLLEPGLTTRHRIERGFKIRHRSVAHTLRTLRNFGATQERIAETERRVAEVLEQAQARGIPVAYDRNKSTDELFANGIAVPLPKNDRLVGDLLRLTAFRNGEGMYDFLSGIVHGDAGALGQFYSYDEAVPDEDTSEGRPSVHPAFLFAATAMPLLAFREAFNRYTRHYGWNDPAWEGWQQHLVLKLYEVAAANPQLFGPTAADETLNVSKDG